MLQISIDWSSPRMFIFMISLGLSLIALIRRIYWNHRFEKHCEELERSEIEAQRLDPAFLEAERRRLMAAQPKIQLTDQPSYLR